MTGNTTLPASNSKKPQGTLTNEPGGFLAPFKVSVEPSLLTLALTHRSWAFEHGAVPHNERLEFLGDSVLGQAVTARLYEEFPDLAEGELAKRRAALVSSTALADIAQRINLGPSIKLGKGERRSGGRNKESILADTIEAVIGAVFLSEGPATADRFVREITDPLFVDIERIIAFFDPKTTLQEEAAARSQSLPQYEISHDGPNHDRRYIAVVALDGVTGQGSGTSKKAAELLAAQDVVQQLQRQGLLQTVSQQDTAKQDTAQQKTVQHEVAQSDAEQTEA